MLIFHKNFEKSVRGKLVVDQLKTLPNVTVRDVEKEYKGNST